MVYVYKMGLVIPATQGLISVKCDTADKQPNTAPAAGLVKNLTHYQHMTEVVLFVVTIIRSSWSLQGPVEKLDIVLIAGLQENVFSCDEHSIKENGGIISEALCKRVSIHHGFCLSLPSAPLPLLSWVTPSVLPPHLVLITVLTEHGNSNTERGWRFPSQGSSDDLASSSTC